MPAGYISNTGLLSYLFIISTIMSELQSAEQRSTVIVIVLTLNTKKHET